MRSLHTADSDPDCQSCVKWEFRYLIAVRAALYVSIRVRSPLLREAVLHFVVVVVALNIKRHGSEMDFERFFSAYCKDVEADADPERLKTSQHTVEVERVWTNHAWTLLDELDQIQPR